MTKILILVLSSPSVDHYKKLMDKQKNTWNSKKYYEINTLFYYANPYIKETYVTGEDLILKTHESYSNLTHKMKLALEYSLSLDWDYVFKTNASSYIDKEKILKLVEDLPSKKCYAGFIAEQSGLAFASGAGTFLSRDCVEILVSNLDKYTNLVDDLAVAQTLKDININPLEINHSRYNYKFDLSFEENIKNIFFTDKNPFHYRFRSYKNREEEFILFDKIFSHLNEK